MLTVGGFGYIGLHLYLRNGDIIKPRRRDWVPSSRIDETIVYLADCSNVSKAEARSEADKEMAKSNLRRCCKMAKNLCYISSARAAIKLDATSYTVHKRECERIVIEHGHNVVRLGSVFGGYEKKESNIMRDIRAIIKGGEEVKALRNEQAEVAVTYIWDACKNIENTFENESVKNRTVLTLDNMIAGDLLQTCRSIYEANRNQRLESEYKSKGNVDTLNRINDKIVTNNIKGLKEYLNG